jgi:tetratricopeptide (TPR) repeat protein
MQHSESTKSLIIIHASADASAVAEFRKRLAPLEIRDQLRIWDLDDIQPGVMRQEAIFTALQGANIVVFWISPDLWTDNSDFNIFLNTKNIIPLTSQVVPIIARHCTWEVLPFLEQHAANAIPADKQPMPGDSKELKDAWMDLAARDVVRKLGLNLPKLSTSRPFFKKITPDGKLGVVIATIFLAVILYLANRHSNAQSPSSQASPCIDFPVRFVRDSLFVLITRFEDYQNERHLECYGEAMRWHINALAQKKQLPIRVCYRDYLSPKDSRDADHFRDENHADIVIWGRLDNAGPDCTSDGFCLLFNPSDTLIRYVGGITHKTDPSDFQKEISASVILQGRFRMGKDVFDNWLIEMFNLKIGKRKPELIVIEEEWAASKKEEAYRTRADIWSGLGRYRESIADLDQAIKINPKNALLYNNRGGNKFDLGHFDEAIADYDRALEIDPDFIIAYTNRGVAKLRSKTHALEALEDLDHVASIAPDFPGIYHTRGDVKFNMHQYKEAIVDYDAAIKISPQDERSYFNRAVAHKALGHLDEAIADYDWVIKNNPNQSVAYINRGAAKAGKRLFNEAIADYDQAIKLNSTDAVAYNNRAGAWYDLGKFDKAVADYNQAINLSPNFQGAIDGKKSALIKLGSYHASVSDYDKELKRDPLNSLAYNNRGGTKSNSGHFADAITDYNEAIRLNPKFAAAYSNRAYAKFGLGDNKGAIEDFDKSIELDSNCVTCYLSRGNFRNNLGLNKEALDDYNRFVKLRPKDPDAYITRGDFWYEQHQYKKAIEDFSRALEINPNLKDLYKKRSTAKRKFGQPVSAFADYCYATWLNTSTRWVWFVLFIFIAYFLKFKSVNRILRRLFTRFFPPEAPKQSSKQVLKTKRQRKP